MKAWCLPASVTFDKEGEKHIQNYSNAARSYIMIETIITCTQILTVKAIYNLSLLPTVSATLTLLYTRIISYITML